MMNQPDTPPPLRSPSKAALRMRRHRERRPDGLRCVTIELRDLLDTDTRNDRRALLTAFYNFLDRTLDS
jgi:hypothetical protein